MMRKSLICFVILAFLNFVIAPEFDAVHAGTGSGGSGFEGASFGSGGGENTGSVLAIVAAVAVVTGLVIYGLVKASQHSKEQQSQPPTVDEKKPHSENPFIKRMKNLLLKAASWP